MVINVVLDNNKIILIFDSNEEARLFFKFLRHFKQQLGDVKDLTKNVQVHIHEEDIGNYIEFLRHKPKKPIQDIETIKDYVNYLKKFIECSNGVIDPKTLMTCIKNKHYASAIRNYLHMKYYHKEISKTQYQELLERIPKFKERSWIAQDRIPVSKILISIAKSFHLKYTTIYLALFYTGGIRLEQLLRSLRSMPRKLDNNAVRIRVLGKGTKAALYAWMPYKLYEELSRIKLKVKPISIVRYINKNLVSATLVRSFCWQTAKQIIGEELALLLQGRVGELNKRVTVRHYDDLIFQLDMKYYEWKKFIDKLVENATTDIKLARSRARKIIEDYSLLMPV